MDIVALGIIGLFPTREQARSASNRREDHREDQPWTLGPIPASLCRPDAPRATAVPLREVAAERTELCDHLPAGSLALTARSVGSAA